MNDQLRAARALRTTIRETRQETEEARCLAPKVVEDLITGGLCRLAVPASLGGHETEPATTLQIHEELAWADASVAWIVWNNQFVGLASRYSPEEVQRELFGDVRRLFANPLSYAAAISQLTPGSRLVSVTPKAVSRTTYLKDFHTAITEFLETFL